MSLFFKKDLYSCPESVKIKAVAEVFITGSELFMDYNNNYNPHTQQNSQYYSQNPRPGINNPGQSMATVAMVLGLASVFCIFTVYLPMIFASIAIILAVLSRGYGKKMLTTAKIGISTAVGGLAMVIALVVSVFSLLMSNGDVLINQGRMLDEQFERQTGQKLEDVFGRSYEDIMRDYVELFQ